MAKVLLKGNEALAEAALAAGCRFYSGYPITPQTEILEYLSWRMEDVGGVFIQAESELAGVNMVLGAAAAGARALTTSSGPGFSLKQEGISYLVAADLPAVIVDVMRIGSGLGDIAQGQGDYWQLTRGGGHGDYHTLVLAPASVQENANMMAEAFDLAEKYRHPVLIASDAAIGQMIEAVEIPEFVEHDINKYDWSIKGCKKGCEQRKIQNVYYTHPDYEGYLSSKYAQMEEEEQRYENIQVEDALKHPNWAMGRKITIDSSTMVNKGLEVIEAKWLFGVEVDKVQVVVQPQSVIHSMVEYEDGAIIAQLGTPDMKLPIQYALYYPERRYLPGDRLDFWSLGKLDFEKPDMDTFYGLALAYEAGRTGGSLPTVFNAANEMAVGQFLNREIKYLEIIEIIEDCMRAHKNIENPTLDQILETEAETYARIKSRR